MPKVTVHRKAHFNAAHRLFNKNWTTEKNELVFGKCSNPNFHGHNYELIVSVTGEVNKETGIVIDLKTLKEIIKEEIEDFLDHKNLNIEIKEFNQDTGLNPTAENISIVIFNKLRPKISTKFDLEITLYETPRNYVSYNGK